MRNTWLKSMLSFHRLHETRQVIVSVKPDDDALARFPIIGTLWPDSASTRLKGRHCDTEKIAAGQSRWKKVARRIGSDR